MTYYTRQRTPLVPHTPIQKTGVLFAALKYDANQPRDDKGQWVAVSFGSEGFGLERVANRTENGKTIRRRVGGSEERFSSMPEAQGRAARLNNPGTRWAYEDGRGAQREGAFQNFYDHGGTDVTYKFRRDSGEIDMVSGSRLKKAKRV